MMILKIERHKYSDETNNRDRLQKTHEKSSLDSFGFLMIYEERMRRMRRMRLSIKIALIPDDISAITLFKAIEHRP